MLYSNLDEFFRVNFTDYWADEQHCNGALNGIYWTIQNLGESVEEVKISKCFFENGLFKVNEYRYKLDYRRRYKNVSTMQEYYNSIWIK